MIQIGQHEKLAVKLGPIERRDRKTETASGHDLVPEKW